MAEEKRTIAGLVVAGPRVAIPNVRFAALKRRAGADCPPHAAAWLRGTRDPARARGLAVLAARLPASAKGA